MTLKQWLHRLLYRRKSTFIWEPSKQCPICHSRIAPLDTIKFCSACGAKFEGGIASPQTDPRIIAFPQQTTGPIVLDMPTIDLPPGQYMRLYHTLYAQRGSAPSTDTLKVSAIRLRAKAG